VTLAALVGLQTGTGAGDDPTGSLNRILNFSQAVSQAAFAIVATVLLPDANLFAGSVEALTLGLEAGSMGCQALLTIFSDNETLQARAARARRRAARHVQRLRTATRCLPSPTPPPPPTTQDATLLFFIAALALQLLKLLLSALIQLFLAIRVRRRMRRAVAQVLERREEARAQAVAAAAVAAVRHGASRSSKLPAAAAAIARPCALRP
jgi:hypothetical protein